MPNNNSNNSVISSIVSLDISNMLDQGNVAPNIFQK